MQQERILSGIRATSKLHIGNYLGALKQFIEIQNNGSAHCYFFVADLHALTTPFEPKELRKNTLEVVAEYLAAGLDPDKSVIFLQNQVHEHSELAWIFECITPLGELERMTQFKDKAGMQELYGEMDVISEEQKEMNLQDSIKNHERLVKKFKEILIARNKSHIGLLAYPDLMAADILLYKPSKVPVGDDQTQHIELSRIIARKFNKQFGEVFPEPKNYMLKPLRIMSLADPTKKMSKSDPKSCLFIDDEPKTIHEKIKKAVTATDGSGKSAGAENLLALLAHFGSHAHIEHFNDMQQTGTLKFSDLKEALSTDIAEHFAEFREKKKELLARPEYLAEVLGEGARKAREVAHETLREVKEKIGLL